jgi:hypothetical protein
METQNLFTVNYLKFCYTCQDAHQCDTEGKCVACWEEKGLLNKEAKVELTTEELLRQYAE